MPACTSTPTLTPTPTPTPTLALTLTPTLTLTLTLHPHPPPGAERFPTLLLNHKKLPDSMLDIDGDRIDATPQSSPSLAPTKAETLPAEVAEMASVVLPLPTSWVGRMLAGWC